MLPMAIRVTITSGLLTMRNSETTVKSTIGINQSVASSFNITLDAILKQSNITGSPCKSVLTAKHKRWLTVQYFSVLNTKDGACCVSCLLPAKPQKNQNSYGPLGCRWDRMLSTSSLWLSTQEQNHDLYIFQSSLAAEF